MKNEVAFLKKVLRLKNSGEGGITELVYKIKELENENQRLKAAKKDRIQNLILENQHLKLSQQASSHLDSDTQGDDISSFLPLQDDFKESKSVPEEDSEASSLFFEDDQVTIKKTR